MLISSIESIIKSKQLIMKLVWSDVMSRYRGSILGISWSFINPVFLLIVYTLVLGAMFDKKWQIAIESKTDYAVVLFSGLILYNLLSEVLSKSHLLIINNTNYVKKVVFPLESLPVITVISSLLHFFISVLVLIIFNFIVHQQIHLTMLYIPFVMIPFIFFLLGISWALASLGVYIRDLSQVVGTVVTALLFLSPVFYPLSAIPEGIREYLYLNPLTVIIEQFRNIAIFGRTPDIYVLALYFLVSIVVCISGLMWFQKSKRGFADVI